MLGLDNPIHIAFLLIVLLLVFGAKRLPEMGKSLGTGMRAFRDSLSADGPHAGLAGDPAAAAPAPAIASASANAAVDATAPVRGPDAEPRVPRAA
jgi:sec-independent protein translocase protein TatA